MRPFALEIDSCDFGQSGPDPGGAPCRVSDKRIFGL
jgi:hypothetical protein